jgi:hypothetical protein
MNAANNASFRWFGIFTILWTAAWCANLAEAWLHAPYDRLGPIAAVAWVLAAIALPRLPVPTRSLLVAAWLASLIGVVGSLNVARHLALVCAVSAWLPSLPLRVTLGSSALVWMPALGWALSGFSPALVNTVRVVAAAGVLAFALVIRTRSPKPLHENP